MRQIWTITSRELSSFFDSLTAYILLVAFLGFSGFFTWLFGGDIFLIGQTSLRGFFGIAYWTLFFFIPAITMGLLAEEKRSGTLELLLTKAVTDRQVVFGKFLAAFLLIFIALSFTCIYVITLANIGNLDNGGVISGYFGLLLMSAAYISIGLFASSLTSNQIVAFLLTLLISLFFHILFDMLAMDSSSFLGQIFSYLSLANHYESITRGVVDSKDLVYFISIIGLGLILAEMSISRRNLSN
jgi:gliding motility-associated transport system permease protein